MRVYQFRHIRADGQSSREPLETTATVNRLRGVLRRHRGPGGRFVVLAALAICTVCIASGEPAHAGATKRSTEAVPFVRTHGGWIARGPGYVLTVDRAGLATLRSREHAAYTSFPLAATGEGASLSGAATTVTASAGGLRVTERRSGRIACLVVVRALRTGILVRASIDVPAPGAGATQVDFLSNGSRALALGGERAGWTPQSGTQVPPSREYMRLPFVSGAATTIDGRTWDAFGPPPLDVALRFRAGWIGIGLVQVPNASTMRITQSSGVAIDYPVATLARIHDTGSGGLYDGLVRFPELALTVGRDPYGVLAGYANLLAQLHRTATHSSTRPAWWRQPLVDTFGQQTLDNATNWLNTKGYTAAWVTRFAHRYQQRFGTRHATLIVDATWQKNPGPLRSEGDPEPGKLFGGYTGMRRLIDSLHHEGFKVLLWWESWRALPGSYAARMGIVHGGCRTTQCPGSRYGRIDPTSAGFPAYVRTVTRRLLGNGPGDLNADGLKLDYAYLEPSVDTFPWSNPARGIGLAAAHRYFATFHHYAHLVKPDALLSAGIATPQFADTIDEIRLDDSMTTGTSSSEDKWQARARVAATVQPQAPIDSDGSRTDAQRAVEHFLTAAVYGVPDLYYVSAWPNGSLGAAGARLVGRIGKLAATRPAGTAVYASPGHWLSLRSGVVVAETLRSAGRGGHLAGVDVWGRKRLHVLATSGAPLAVPLHQAVARSVTAAGRRRIAWHLEGQRLVLRLRPGEEATVSLTRGPQPCGTASRCARGW